MKPDEGLPSYGVPYFADEREQEKKPAGRDLFRLKGLNMWATCHDKVHAKR